MIALHGEMSVLKDFLDSAKWAKVFQKSSKIESGAKRYENNRPLA
jgi:hypothetical protein